MEVILEPIANNPLFTLGSFVVSILLAVFFYFLSQKNKIPCYEAVSYTIIEGLHNSLGELKVYYKGSVQKRITATRMVFWNDGKETIDKRDTVEKDLLRIEIPSFIEVLDIKIIDFSSDSNSVSMQDKIVSEDKSIYPLDFEYLDNNEYFVIQIIHNASAEEEFGFKGKIKGVQSFRSVQSLSRNTIPFIAPARESIGARILMKYVISLTFFVSGIFSLWHLFNGKTDWYVWLGAVYCFLAAVFTYYTFRHTSPVKL